MRQTYIITSAELEKLKQAARKLKRSSGIPHHEALEKVAIEMGLPNWHQVSESAQVTSLSEKAYFTGLVLGMDVKDSLDFDLKGRFVEDEQFFALCFDDIKEIYGEIEDEEDGTKIKDTSSEEDLIEGAQEWMMNLRFFRFTGSPLPGTIEQALKLVREHSFWPPQYVWLRGEVINTYNAPAIDEDGEIVGVRL